MKTKPLEIYGIEVDKAEARGIVAWMDMPEAKAFKRILEALTDVAESNSMQDFSDDLDVGLSQLRREQYLGERKGLRKISRIPTALRELL